MRSRATTAGVLGLGLALASPDVAVAHGIASREDLPIPTWLVVYGAAVVLLISVAALAGLWTGPRLRGATDHVLLVVPPGVARWSRRILAWCGLVMLLLVVAAGLLGSARPDANLASVLVYTLFWVGLVPLSMLFGDVFQLVNPWRAIGKTLLIRRRPAVRPYPASLGHIPAIAGLAAFGALELAGLVLGRRHLASFLAPSLVPIAIAYVVAHYATFLLYGVQIAIRVASDPFGSGLDLFGTARMQVSLSVVPADVLRYVQVGAVFLGHIAALVVAHDLVFELEPPRSKLTRAQIPMLVAMIALTTLALWLLANANA